MEFFNNTRTLEALAQAWNDRKVAMRKAEDQEFCDMLFKSIYQSVQVRREEIYDDLKEVIGTATHTTQLWVPIWTYTETRFKRYSPTYHEKMGAHAKLGNDWTIYNADQTKERRVVNVMRNSDICARLATVFGHNFVVCDVPTTTFEETDEYRVIHHQVRMYYYPEHWKRNAPSAFRHRKALEKYNGVALRDEEPLLYTGEDALPEDLQEELRRVLLGY